MSVKRRLLLVDDDKDLRQALAEQLVLTGEFETAEAPTGANGVEQAAAGGFDLIILDVGLPDIDGREALPADAQAGVKAPIVMLTGAAEEGDQVQGLEAGANDYVTKPFRFAVLLARVRASAQPRAERGRDLRGRPPPSSRPPSCWRPGGPQIRPDREKPRSLKYLYRQGRAVARRHCTRNLGL